MKLEMLKKIWPIRAATLDEFCSIVRRNGGKEVSIELVFGPDESLPSVLLGGDYRAKLIYRAKSFDGRPIIHQAFFSRFQDEESATMRENLLAYAESQRSSVVDELPGTQVSIYSDDLNLTGRGSL